ncbi:MAG: hypothetical protein AAFP19_00085 [Bacteroidota bacterium]
MNQLMISLLLLSACFWQVHAQEKFSLTILAIDKETKTGIDSVKVFAKEAHSFIYTNADGLGVFRKVLPEEDISLVLTKEGYVPIDINTSRISSMITNNIAIIEMIKLPPENRFLIYGKIEGQRARNVPKALVEVGGWIEQAFHQYSDSLGNYFFQIPKPKDELRFNELRFKVSHPDYKVYKKNYILQPGQQYVQIYAELEERFRWHIPLSTASYVGGSVLIGFGIDRFFEGKRLHDDYEEYLDEAVFLAEYPQYENREEAYLVSEDQRVRGRNLISAGIVFVALPSIYYLARGIKKKRFKNLGVGLIQSPSMESSTVQMTLKF